MTKHVYCVKHTHCMQIRLTKNKTKNLHSSILYSPNEGITSVWYATNIECKFANSFTLQLKNLLQWLYHSAICWICCIAWKYAIFGCEYANQYDRIRLSKWQFNTWFIQRFVMEFSLFIYFQYLQNLYTYTIEWIDLHYTYRI